MILYGEDRWHEMTRVGPLRPANELPTAIEIPQTEDWMLLHVPLTRSGMNRFTELRLQVLAKSTDTGGAFQSVAGGRSQ
jgi:hypothetical protein